MTGRPAVSVVIVNWNTREILRDCLESVWERTRDIQFEVIVVDNASEDGSVGMVKESFPQVRLVENAENRGFAAANNQGLAIACGCYVLLLNSDTIVLDNAIAKAVQFADDHPEAAVVGCRVLNLDRSLQPTCFMFPSVLNLMLSSLYLYKVFPHNRFLGRERMTWWQRDDVREVDVVTGCFMLVRRSAIEEVGGMDEAFFMYGEETDWCCRFKKAGWKNLFTPVAQIIHLGGASSRQVKPRMIMQLRASILLFIKKHSGRARYACACILVAVFFAVRIPFWLVLGVVSKGRRTHAWEYAKTYAKAGTRALLGWRALAVSDAPFRGASNA